MPALYSLLSAMYSALSTGQVLVISVGRYEVAADKILTLHQTQDKQGSETTLEPKRQARIDALRNEAARTRKFVASNPKRLNRKGQELKTNVTDPRAPRWPPAKASSRATRLKQQSTVPARSSLQPT